MKYFKFKSVAQEDMLLKYIYCLEVWLPFCSAQQNHLCNFSRGYYEEHFCENIYNLDQWFRMEMLFKAILYLELSQPFCLAKPVVQFC